MLIIKRGYQRKYQVGGSGIFSKLKDFLSGFISKKQVVDTALNIDRSAGKRLHKKLLILRVQSQNLCLQQLRLHPEGQHVRRHGR